MSFTIIIIAITVLVSIIAFSNAELLEKLIFYPARMHSPAEYYRFITSGLIHADFIHLFFNMYVAHFREVAEHAVIADRFGLEVLSRDRAPAFSDAWPHFLANPFNFGSILGIGLFVIGLCIFGYASYEGYKGFTDPYPGFGKIGKRFYVNRFLRMSLEDRARNACYRQLDKVRERIETAARLHAHFKDEVFKAISFTELLAKSAETAEARINTHGWSLISAYRAANKRKRLKLMRKAERKPDKGLFNPGRPPAYFDNDPRNGWPSTLPSVGEVKQQAQNAYELIEENLEVIDQARKYIAQTRSRVDELIEEKMDQEDRELKFEAKRVYERNSNSRALKVVKQRA